jgi:hypothetical protein
MGASGSMVPKVGGYAEGDKIRVVFETHLYVGISDTDNVLTAQRGWGDKDDPHFKISVGF